ncbi:thioredoxin-like protein [Mycena rosella]|uniref:Thioredoxin-like protein n=1 Tax=Mycena rosella TaxID=1033263 RepID=A0AAD7BM73_MYCRO|nr:thioredoxin-like protein [Mycena rosella]
MAIQKRVVKLSVINDLICPNCAVGQHELFSAISHCKDDLKLPLDFQLEFLPFRLISTALLPQDYEPKVAKTAFFEGVFGAEKFGQLQESIAKWGAEKGVPLTFRGVVSQSTRAHRLSRKAFHVGGMERQLPFLMAIFRVHLQEGKDVADIGVLSDVAAEVGVMSKTDAIAFLNSNELEDEVNSMCDEARAKGITGVPLTVIDGNGPCRAGSRPTSSCRYSRSSRACTSPTPRPSPSRASCPPSPRRSSSNHTRNHRHWLAFFFRSVG